VAAARAAQGVEQKERGGERVRQRLHARWRAQRERGSP
jgi:hypothetical protein